MSDFYYQIGSIITEKQWSRPFYEKIRSFLLDETASSILDKYKAVIFGGVLYHQPTWDLDIRLMMDYDDTTDWNIVEKDINTLNDISLNTYNFLTDIGLSKHYAKTITKQELIEDNKGLPIASWVTRRTKEDDGVMIKIGYEKKLINNIIQIEYDNPHNHERLTDGYLIKKDIHHLPHAHKMVKKILSIPEPFNSAVTLTPKAFLSMSREEFYASQIPVHETFEKYGV